MHHQETVPDRIAELIRAGHTNTSIAHRLHCHPETVARARRALRMPHADELGRLYAEAHPRGTAEYRPGRQPISPHRAAANRAELLAALTADPDRPARHLTAVPPAA